MQSAERMVAEIHALVEELASLRADNETLRRELRDAITLLDRASSALAGSSGRPRVRRRGGDTAAAVTATAGANGRGRRRRPGAAPAARPAGRPAGVTPEVVRGVIGRLGEASAKEVAEELARMTGAAINGRQIRFWAEQADGVHIETVDGQRRYRLG